MSSNHLHESIYEIMFNKSQRSEQEMKQSIVRLLEMFYRHATDNLKTHVQNEYLLTHRDYFKTTKLQDVIQILSSTIEWKEIPVYYANELISYLIEYGVIQIPTDVLQYQYDKDFVLHLSKMIPKEEDLHLIHRIMIDEQYEKVTIQFQYRPTDNIKSLSHELEMLRQEYDTLSKREQKKVIKEQIEQTAKCLETQSEYWKALQTQYISMKDDSFEEEIQLIQSSFLPQMKQMSERFVSQKDIKLVQMEIHKIEWKLHKIQKDYQYMKKGIQTLETSMQSQQHSISWMKSKIFQYFTFLKQLEYSLYELKVGIQRCMNNYDDLLSRQLHVQDKIQEMKGIMESLSSTQKTSELSIFEQELNYRYRSFQQGKLDILELETEMIPFRFTWTELVNRVMTTSASVASSSSSSLLKKHGKQSKKTLITEELTRLMQQNDAVSSTGGGSHSELDRLMDRAILLQIVDKALYELVLNAKQMIRLYQWTKMDYKRCMRKRDEILQEKNTFLTTINESIRHLSEKSQDKHNGMEMNHTMEEKQLICRFYNKYLSHLEKRIQFYQQQSSLQQYQLQRLMKNIKNSVESNPLASSMSSENKNGKPVSILPHMQEYSIVYKSTNHPSSYRASTMITTAIPSTIMTTDDERKMKLREQLLKREITIGDILNRPR